MERATVEKCIVTVSLVTLSVSERRMTLQKTRQRRFEPVLLGSRLTL